MSLDKWIKPDKKQVNKKKTVKTEKESTPKTSLPNQLSLGAKISKKYNLTCSKKSCGYQKTIMKRELTEKDKICPRCKSNMKVK